MRGKRDTVMLLDRMFSSFTCMWCNNIQLLHLNEINMRFYGAEYNNIERGEKPSSILLYSAPQNLILIKFKCSNCFITYDWHFPLHTIQRVVFRSSCTQFLCCHWPNWQRLLKAILYRLLTLIIIRLCDFIWIVE
jgi:hypothetical protein